MLFHDGVDSQGRPVIVVNTDAVGTGRKARSAAMQYMLHRLEPIVTQVSMHSFSKTAMRDCKLICHGLQNLTCFCCRVHPCFSIHSYPAAV